MPLDELMYHSLIAVAIIAVSYCLARLLRWLLATVGRRLITRTENVLDDRLLDSVLSHLLPLVMVAGVFVAVREVRKGAAPADVTVLQVLEYADSLLYIVGVILIVRLLLGILREIIQWYLDTAAAGGAVSLRLTLGPLTSKVVNILVGMVAVIVILDHFGINIGSLLVSLGVGSLAVALAAQDTLANMIAGFVILVDRPFRVGDRIELIPGVIGDVQAIGLRSTRVLNFDQNTVIIPNADLVKGRIINHAYPQGQMRVTLKVDVAYGTDTDKVRSLLTGLAASHPDILAEPAPQVFVTALGESSVQLTLVARCRDYTTQWGAETTLREQAYGLFQREGIEMPTPRRAIQMKGED